MLRNTMEPSHNNGQIHLKIWGQYHQKLAFCIVFSNLCLGSFPKRTFGDSKKTHGNWMIFMGLMKHKICNCLLNYTKAFYPEKKVFALPPACHSRLPLCSQTPSPCSYPQTATGQEDYLKNRHKNHKNTILYTNIFIEVHCLKCLSDTQPPSSHSISSRAIYYAHR